MSVVLGNVRGTNGEKGERGNDGQKGDRGTSLRMRGKWTSGVQYVNSALFIDIVYYKGSSYYCKNTITSAISPDGDPTNWGTIATGTARVLANFQIQTADFEYDNSGSGHTYIATYHFQMGTFPQNGVVNMAMDQDIMRAGGVEFGGVQNDVAIIYCDDRSVFTAYTVYAKIYCDLVSTQIVSPL